MTEHLRERVVAYADLLTDDIGQIQQLLAQVRELAESQEPARVHMLAERLTAAHLDTDWVDQSFVVHQRHNQLASRLQPVHPTQHQNSFCAYPVSQRLLRSTFACTDHTQPH